MGPWEIGFTGMAAGIDTTAAEPGFHVISLHPNFDSRLGSVDFSYESSYGTIHSAWTVSGKQATWNLTIPPNATGRLALTAAEQAAYRLDGKALSGNSKIVAGGETDSRKVF